MAAYRELTPNGERFFALALYFKHESENCGQRLRIGRLIKAWTKGNLRDLSVKFAKTQEE